MVHLVPNVHTLAGHVIGAIRLAPTATLHFDTVHKTKYLFSHLMILYLMDPELFIYQLFKFASIGSLDSIRSVLLTLVQLKQNC